MLDLLLFGLDLKGVVSADEHADVTEGLKATVAIVHPSRKSDRNRHTFVVGLCGFVENERVAVALCF
jgi:hypothetical protein